MELKTRILLVVASSVFWVLAATTLIAPGARSTGRGEAVTGSYGGEPDFVRDVRCDVATLVIGSF